MKPQGLQVAPEAPEVSYHNVLAPIPDSEAAQSFIEASAAPALGLPVNHDHSLDLIFPDSPKLTNPIPVLSGSQQINGNGKVASERRQSPSLPHIPERRTQSPMSFEQQIAAMAGSSAESVQPRKRGTASLADLREDPDFIEPSGKVAYPAPETWMPAAQEPKIEETEPHEVTDSPVSPEQTVDDLDFRPKNSPLKRAPHVSQHDEDNALMPPEMNGQEPSHKASQKAPQEEVVDKAAPITEASHPQQLSPDNRQQDEKTSEPKKEKRGFFNKKGAKLIEGKADQAIPEKTASPSLFVPPAFSDPKQSSVVIPENYLVRQNENPMAPYQDSMADNLERFGQKVILQDTRFLKRSIDNLVDNYFRMKEDDDS